MKIHALLKKTFILAMCSIYITTHLYTMFSTIANKAPSIRQTAAPALGAATGQLLNTTSSNFNKNYNPQVKNYNQQPASQPFLTTPIFKPTHTIQNRQYSTLKNFDEADWDAPRNHAEIIEFLDNQYAGQFDNNVNIPKIAWALQNMSYQKIASIMRITKNQSGGKKIDMADFYRAINNYLNGQNSPTQKTDFLKKQTAYHEAGHAVAELLLSTSTIIPMITTQQYGNLEGSVTRVLGHTQNFTLNHTINEMIMRLAGIVTEQVFGIGYDPQMLTDNEKIFIFLSHESATDDMNKFTKSLKKFIKINNLTENKAEDLIVELYQITYNFISQHTTEIEQLATLLIDKGTLYEDEIYSILNASKPLYRFEPGPLTENHADQYIYRGQPNPYGYDERGNYIGEKGYRDKNGNLPEID